MELLASDLLTTQAGEECTSFLCSGLVPHLSENALYTAGLERLNYRLWEVQVKDEFLLQN